MELKYKLERENKSIQKPDDYNYQAFDNLFDASYEFILIKLIIGEVIYKGKLLFSHNRKYGKEIINVIKAEFFTSTVHQIIIQIIKDYYDEENDIPDYKQIKYFVGKINDKNVVHKEDVEAELIQLYKSTVDKSKANFVKKHMLTFMERQHLKNAIADLYNKINNNQINTLKEGISYFKSSTNKVKRNTNAVNVHDKKSTVLLQDNRYKTSLGWGKEFDKIYKPTQGSVSVGIAPTGVGKTTSAAATAANGLIEGKNILLLFFEDSVNQVYQKIIASVLNKEINYVKNNYETAEKLFHNKLEKNKDKWGKVVIEKLPLNNTDTNDIRERIDNFIDNYGSPEILILDYLDCLKAPKYLKFTASQKYDEQIFVMKEILDIADVEVGYGIFISTYVQTVKNAGESELIKKGDSGGSYERIKLAPQSFGMSRIKGKNTFQIFKNREGEVAIFYDVLIDNAKVKLEIKNANSVEEVARDFDIEDFGENDLEAWQNMQE